MANFDAMVPLIPRDSRIPVTHDREQLRVNQVEKTKAIEKINDDEANTITDNDARRQQHSSQQQPSTSPSAAEDEQPEKEADDDGHIDTYA